MSGHRELNTASDHHLDNDINVPQSDGENLSICPAYNQLGEERFLNQTSPTTCQLTCKSPNMILKGQLSQEVNDTNIIPSTVEVPRANDEHLENARKNHFVNATTKELRSCSMDPSLAPTLQAITNKYGDIARECLLESTFTHTFMLEGICKVVEELNCKKLDKLDANSLYDYDSFLKDAETMKFNVKWLRLRLNELHDGVKSLVETKQATDEKTKLMERNDYLKKNLQMEKSKIEEQELELAMNSLDVNRLNNKISVLATRYQCFQGKSVIDGLL